MGKMFTPIWFSVPFVFDLGTHIRHMDRQTNMWKGNIAAN